LPEAPYREVISAERDGFLRFINLEELGFAGIHLGAGRKLQLDILDPAVGIEVMCTAGQAVQKGDPIYVIHYSDTQRLPAARECLYRSFQIADQPFQPGPRVTKVLM